MPMINRAALIYFLDDINDDEDDVFHFKYIVMQANQTKGFRREFFSFAQIVHPLNIFLLFTKIPISINFRKQLDVFLGKAKHGNNTPSNLHFSLDLAYSYRPKYALLQKREQTFKDEPHKSSRTSYRDEKCCCNNYQQ